VRLIEAFDDGVDAVRFPIPVLVRKRDDLPVFHEGRHHGAARIAAEDARARRIAGVDGRDEAFSSRERRQAPRRERRGRLMLPHQIRKPGRRLLDEVPVGEVPSDERQQYRTRRCPSGYCHMQEVYEIPC